MINSLHIENFQSHRDTVVEFSPGVTAFIGLNNHGKSAIFRALQKVVRDVPEGKTFISDGESTCKISLTSEGRTVLRQVKTEATASDGNVYAVGDSIFAKFGAHGIPQEVLDALQISPIQSFGDFEFDLNFQHQLDPPFLVVGNGLESIRGKVLGRIAGVHVVNRAIQLAVAEAKRISQEKSKTEKIKAEVENQLEDVKYSQLDVLLQQVQKSEQALREAQLREKLISQLSEKLSLLSSCIERANRISSISKVLQVDLDSIPKALAEKQAKLEKLFEIRERFHLTTLRRDQCRDIISSVTISFDTQRITSIADIVHLLKQEKKKLDQCQSQIETTSLRLQRGERELEVATKQLHQLKDEIGVCPVCERPFE